MIRRSRRSPKPDRRRALELLAACPDGCTEAIMVAHGFTTAAIVGLVRAGLASAVVAGSRTMEVATVRIHGCGTAGTMARRARRRCKRSRKAGGSNDEARSSSGILTIFRGRKTFFECNPQNF